MIASEFSPLQMCCGLKKPQQALAHRPALFPQTGTSLFRQPNGELHSHIPSTRLIELRQATVRFLDRANLTSQDCEHAGNLIHLLDQLLQNSTCVENVASISTTLNEILPKYESLSTMITQITTSLHDPVQSCRIANGVPVSSISTKSFNADALINKVISNPYVIAPAHRYEKVGRFSLITQLKSMLLTIRAKKTTLVSSSTNYYQPLSPIDLNTMVTSTKSSKPTSTARTGTAKHVEAPKSYATKEAERKAAKALQVMRAKVTNTDTWRNKPELVETMSMASLEARLHDEAASRYNKLQRNTLEERLAKNIAELKAMDLPSPVLSPARTESTVATDTSSDNDVLYIPGPFSARKNPVTHVAKDENAPWEVVEQRSRSLTKWRAPRAPAYYSLPLATNTFDDDEFPEAEGVLGNYTLHSPSYESEFPSLPPKYAEHESVIHSISTIIHPMKPAENKEGKTPVFRRMSGPRDTEMATSAEEAVSHNRKRFQESWEDSLVDTYDDEATLSVSASTIERPLAQVHAMNMQNARAAVEVQHLSREASPKCTRDRHNSVPAPPLATSAIPTETSVPHSTSEAITTGFL